MPLRATVLFLFSFRFLTDFSVRAMRAVIFIFTYTGNLQEQKSCSDGYWGLHTYLQPYSFIMFFYFVYTYHLLGFKVKKISVMFQHAWVQYVTRNLVTHTLALRHAHSGIHTASFHHKGSLYLHLTCSHTLRHYCSLILWHYCTH